MQRYEGRGFQNKGFKMGTSSAYEEIERRPIRQGINEQRGQVERDEVRKVTRAKFSGAFYVSL